MFSKRTFRLLTGGAHLFKHHKTLAYLGSIPIATTIHSEATDRTKIRASKCNIPKIELDSNIRKIGPYQLLWRTIRQHSLLSLSTLLTSLIAAYTGTIAPRILSQCINSVGDLLRNGSDLNQLFSSLHSIALNYFGYSILNASLITMNVYMLGILARKIADDLQLSLYMAFIENYIPFHDQFSASRLCSYLSVEINQFRQNFKTLFGTGSKCVTSSISSLINMLSISKTMTFGLVSSLSFVITFGTGFGWFLQRLSWKSKCLDSELLAHSHDVLSNIRTVKLFTAEEYEIERLSELQRKCYEANKSFSFFVGIFDGLSELLTATMVGSVLFVGCSLITKDVINFGDLFGFLNSASLAQKSMSQIGPLQSSARKMKESLELIAGFLPMEIANSNHSDIKLEIQGAIDCLDLSFAYPNRSNAVSHLNLTIKPGSMVGICGPSGSGKSTLAALLTRLYDPPDSHLFIDGVDVNRVDPKYLRQQIGLINQEASLFEGTIAENIRYGSHEATDEEVLAAANLANVTEFALKLPLGFDTQVGNRGHALSGGQKQRIAIARTILKNPKILILDEATSALDNISERQVQDALERIRDGRTVIVIAHRLSTIKDAAVIHVMENGQIIESGNHHELLARKGIYHKMLTP